MNDLARLFFANKNGGYSPKLDHYFEIYDRHFSRFRGTEATIVEIGVSKGGSLELWRDYFGPGARIVGIDLDPSCTRFEGPKTQIFIGSQYDKAFLLSVAQRIGPIDVLIDDGSHYARHQVRSFRVLFPHMSPRGVYLCEDAQTSYWWEYGGGLIRKGTIIEHAKSLVDEVNAWHARSPHRLPVSEITRTTTSVHFYDSVVIVERAPRTMPELVESGVAPAAASGHQPSRFRIWLTPWLADAEARPFLGAAVRVVRSLWRQLRR